MSLSGEPNVFTQLQGGERGIPRILGGILGQEKEAIRTLKAAGTQLCIFLQTVTNFSGVQWVKGSEVAPYLLLLRPGLITTQLIISKRQRNSTFKIKSKLFFFFFWGGLRFQHAEFPNLGHISDPSHSSGQILTPLSHQGTPQNPFNLIHSLYYTDEPDSGSSRSIFTACRQSTSPWLGSLPMGAGVGGVA